MDSHREHNQAATEQPCRSPVPGTIDKEADGEKERCGRDDPVPDEESQARRDALGPDIPESSHLSIARVSAREDLGEPGLGRRYSVTVDAATPMPTDRGVIRGSSVAGSARMMPFATVAAKTGATRLRLRLRRWSPPIIDLHSTCIEASVPVRARKCTSSPLWRCFSSTSG